jgi:tRNA G18 (ribose-2'-O)-methylase SpoU
MDPRAALYRGVSDSELLRAHGLFIAEGRLIVRRVIEDGRYKLHSILVSDAARRDLAGALACVRAEVPVIEARLDEFRQLTGVNIHRGCLALVHRPPERSGAEAMTGPGPLLLLEGINNADNVGGIFRNAAAFGAAGVLLDEQTCDPFYRKAVRTSMGAVLRVPFARVGSWPQALAQVKACRSLLALTPGERAVPIHDLVTRHGGAAPALVLGAEGAGLSTQTLAAADVMVRIPTTGYVDSLNVAVAAGVALFALTGSRLNTLG